MAVAAPEQTVLTTLPRRRFTFAEYERIHDVGIIAEDERVELVQGEIVEMAAIGVRHAKTVTAVDLVLHERLGRQAIIMVQNPVRLPDHSMPQLDLAVIRPDYDWSLLPAAADVLIVIEVADSSLAYDRAVKLPLYAAAGIPEAWLLDLTADRIERHGDPSPDGYQQIVLAGRGKTLASLVLPSLTISVDEVLGPPQ